MRKRLILTALVLFSCISGFGFDDAGCSNQYKEQTAGKEAEETEKNQAVLFAKQPPPKIDWSLERDQLISRVLLQNDRTVNFFMYVFIEGDRTPIGYYQVRKVSSVDSQLTNTDQLVRFGGSIEQLPSPSEDGSYGTNGEGVFGFTPEGIYVETDMHYITSTVPLTFKEQPPLLAVINTDDARKMLANSNRVVEEGKKRIEEWIQQAGASGQQK